MIDPLFLCVQDPVPKRPADRRRGGGPLQALLARHRARRMGKGELACVQFSSEFTVVVKLLKFLSYSTISDILIVSCPR